MNLNLIDDMPIELRRNIYGFIPYKSCIVCHHNHVIFDNESKHHVCSIICLRKFNKHTLSQLRYNNSIILTQNISLTVYYGIITVHSFFLISTSIMLPACIFLFVIFNIYRLLIVICHTLL